jgi:hypothetical protein
MSNPTSNANATPDMNGNPKIRVNIKKKDVNNNQDLVEHTPQVVVPTGIPKPEIKMHTKRTNTLLLERLVQLEKENPNLYHIETNGIVTNEEIADFLYKCRP